MTAEKHIAGLKAKLDVATTPLQKANFKQQIAVLLAGKDTDAVAKLRAEYNVAKAEIFAAAKKADEAVALAKATEEAAALAKKRKVMASTL